ncbi:MAG TPA: sugar transferase [Clostridia bacterium]|nr:sugar transferase [Clostridia bacterium]
MVRLLNAYFPARTVLLCVTELLLVTLGLVGGTVIWTGLVDADLALFYEGGFLKITLITAVVFVWMYYFDLYDSTVLGNRREVFTRITQVLGTTCVSLAAIYFMFPQSRLTMRILGLGAVFVIIALAFGRRLFLLVNTSERFAQRAIILGDGPLVKPLIEEINNRPELGIMPVGIVGEQPGVAGVPNIGSMDQLLELVVNRRVDRIFIDMAERRGKMPVDLLLELKTCGISIQDASALYETLHGKIPLQSLKLSWLLFSPGFQPTRASLFYKRFVSLLLATPALIISLPVMLLVAIAIRLESAGPAIFRQKRVGKGGETFTLYKFRSMRDGCDSDGNNRPAVKDDDRITRLGHFLRRSRLDELPQLFNIVRGDMYIVGPRPFVISQEQEYVKQIPFYRQRWVVRPGATGWAQVNRPYCATIEDNREKLEYDLFYIKNVSFGLDVLILFKTLKILLLGRGGQ